MANSNIENEIILLSIDKALDDVDFIVDKSTFYTTLKKTHGLKRQDIPICFNVFHKALKEIYGVYHYRIRTQIVKHIHELDGNEHYSRNEVRSAFIKIMKAFNADSMISSKELEKVTEERMAKIKANERLAIIGETAGMVGHDIRNPLQAIVSDVYLLKDYLKAMPNISIKNGVAESLDGIEQCVDYINKIVLDLQDFVKPLVPNFKETNLEMILDQVLVKKAIPENIKVNCKVEPEAKNLISDPDLLKRILANLINNAVQA
ncbi:MAG: hypothetical protein ACM3WQ_03845, partial [Chloroflexota bacterium]